MKSELKSYHRIVLAAFLAVCLSQSVQAQKPELSVAALSLPGESTGLVHWRSSNAGTKPLQLSVRYFSERIELESNFIEFYTEPIDAATADEPPAPFLRMRIPEGRGTVYLVISGDLDDENNTRWRGNMLNGNDWKAGSMKVFNAFESPLGIVADGKNPIQIAAGSSVDLHARDFDETGFPVRIYRLEPERRVVFSSKWRVAEDRRELLFIGNNQGRLTLRALMEL